MNKIKLDSFKPMQNTKTLIPLDTWIPTKWSDFLEMIEDPAYEKKKAYYYHHSMRLEMLSVGFDHSRDHSMIIVAIHLFCILNNIPLTLADNCSYRKVGIKECQPDISCYIGTQANIIPQGTNIVNLDQYSPPDLVVEVAKTSFLDDIGTKRSLYESLNIKEYWIIDVQNRQIIAYTLEPKGSYLIQTSSVLLGLNLSILEEALRKNQQEDQAAVGQWLMQQFQS
ncbi:MAG: Uma2 family endonuclease [Crocosphaera sp.]|nr:Uma2 family endonuclease [Crocosphaera sp.]